MVRHHNLKPITSPYRLTNVLVNVWVNKLMNAELNELLTLWIKTLINRWMKTKWFNDKVKNVKNQ